MSLLQRKRDDPGNPKKETAGMPEITEMIGKTDMKTDSIEKIGNVTLDYSKYPGEDLYCDGAVEDELLEIVKTTDPAEFPRIIEERHSWPILYHLSTIRENIVEWLPMDKHSKVLEVGSGCGAITGVLARKAGSVTCVELSRKRTLINAYRHRDCDNVEIHVGNFKDIEPKLPADYDYILLIGVLEYADGYIGGDTSHEDFIRILQKHLAGGGRIVIAIENKYGLKYFAGCREDHTGGFFDGIEDYPENRGVRTFGREGLDGLLARVFPGERHFYYPYPDYKFMKNLYSDDRLPKAGELTDNIRNFDRDRMVLFDEKQAYDGLIREGSFPFFSNSFLVVLGEQPDTVYARYSNDRACEYAICTRIERAGQNGFKVRKLPLCKEAEAHVGAGRMLNTYRALKERYEGGNLTINRCISESEEQPWSEYEYASGEPLSELMDRKLAAHDMEGFYGLFQEYIKRVSYVNERLATGEGAEGENAGSRGCASKGCVSMDLIFSNILVEKDEWTLIDYEWVTGDEPDIRRLMYKALYCYVLENERRAVFDRNRVLGMLKLSEMDAADIEREEREFQKRVTGGRASLEEIRERIGNEVIKPEKIAGMSGGADNAFLQIYEDRGEGFREENSYFVKQVRVGGGVIDCEIRVDEGLKRLRIDPGSRPCALRMEEISLDGRSLLMDAETVATNGMRLKNTDLYLFDTADPNITVSLKKQTFGTLKFRAYADILSEETARQLAYAKRPLF